MFRITATLIAGSACLLGQTTANSNSGPQTQTTVRIGDVAQFGPIGITTAMAAPLATIAGAPYSAQTVTERIQTLADGNRIVQSSSGSVARDSQGRVRRDEALPGLASETGDAPHLVTIADPVAGAHWTLNSQSKTAIKMPFTQMRAGDPSVALPPPGLPPPGNEKTFFLATGAATSETHVQVIARNESSNDSNVAKTDLGTQNMEGVTAQGTRITRTIPAGAIGNDQPLVITTETWYSPDLKVLVMSKTDDPRMGETTYKLTNIQRSEPAASLFQIPDDYTVKDQPANTFFYREPPKNP